MDTKAQVTGPEQKNIPCLGACAISRIGLRAPLSLSQDAIRQRKETFERSNCGNTVFIDDFRGLLQPIFDLAEKTSQIQGRCNRSKRVKHWARAFIHIALKRGAVIESRISLRNDWIDLISRRGCEFIHLGLYRVGYGSPRALRGNVISRSETLLEELHSLGATYDTFFSARPQAAVARGISLPCIW